MKPTLLGIALLVLIALTNPPTHAHIQEVENLIMAEIPAEAAPLANIGRAMISGMLPKVISRENYLIFSFTIFKIVDAKHGQIIGVGLLNNVFIFDSFKSDLASRL
ncbi:hypothetical protein ES708_03041 [subsurface metagenome]